MMRATYAYACHVAELLGLLMLAGAASAMVGCGASTTDAARATLATSARIVSAVDTANADAMRETREADIEAATSREDALRRRSPYWRVQEAVDGARALLYAAEATLDAGGQDALLPIAWCVGEALVRLREAVRVLVEATGADVPVPPAIDLALHALQRYGGVCRAPGGAS